VVAVITAEDMGDEWAPGPPLVSPPPTVKEVTFNSRRQVPLARIRSGTWAAYRTGHR
jgi:hypothetical protein